MPIDFQLTEDVAKAIADLKAKGHRVKLQTKIENGKLVWEAISIDDGPFKAINREVFKPANLSSLLDR